MTKKAGEIACPKCGQGGLKIPRRFKLKDEPTTPVQCLSCGHILTSEEVKHAAGAKLLDLVEEMKADLRPKK